MNRRFYALGLFVALVLSSCYHASEKIQPKIDFTVQDKYLLSLPSPFPPLSPIEKKEEWAREYRIALCYARELDLYQAIVSFKRARFLIEDPATERLNEIDYGIFLCYYLGRKTKDALYTFEHSSLQYITTSFPAAEDLSILVYDLYIRDNDERKAARMRAFIEQNFPAAADKLAVYSALIQANTEELVQIAQKPTYSYIGPFIADYHTQKKSITKAKYLNALCPGAGYFYLGQTQSAITALLLNGSFIAASAYFFSHGNMAAGGIFAGFEAGWYLGGIYGAGHEAKFYNERLYEKGASKLMNEKGLFPGFMIRYAF